MRPLVIQKFGGTSVGSVERIESVAELVAKSLPIEQLVVVVSAMAGETNKLVALAKQMSPDPLPQAYDMLLASGEQVTAALLAIALHKRGVNALPLLGFQVGIETDDLYSKARIHKIDSQVLRRHLETGVTPIVAGFQGVFKGNGESNITTLGRGGSDTSAVALAAALEAARCDIFTDVDGVYSADPRFVKDARRIATISFGEMMELAALGAKVLHMRSVELAAKFNVRLRVLSSFTPETGGTTLVKESDMLESPVVSAITTDSAECLLSMKIDSQVAMYPARYFRPLADAGINVDVIVQTPADAQGLCSLSFTVPQDEGTRALELLAAFSARISQPRTVKISVVGLGMRTHSGVAVRMFESLERAEIPIHLITTSEIKISALIPEGSREKALNTLHKEFKLDEA